jgi:hypothetical protein
MTVRIIISGGQTGADQGGLAAGIDLGLKVGGWAPKGYRTEKGSQPVLAQLGLKQHASESYLPRTDANVQTADGTLVFGNASSSGSKTTISATACFGKPVFVQAWRSGEPVPNPTAFRAWLVQHKIEVLNVAGNRESIQPGIAVAVRTFVKEALSGESTP